jgi:hypothetical protein
MHAHGNNQILILEGKYSALGVRGPCATAGDAV